MQGRGSDAPNVLLLGHGEVGRAFAGRLAGTAGSLVIVDPAAPPAKAVSLDLPASFEAIDLVLAAVPASASKRSAEVCAGKPGDFLYVDCASSSRAAMREAAACFEEQAARFADAAIMGSIDLAGADAPIVVAGEDAAEAAHLLATLGFAASAMEASQPGDASALKLVRSIVTKGLEAVAVEGFLAARTMGLEDQLRESLSDVGRSGFPDFLDSIVRTHVSHATRRAHEVAAAVAQIEEQGGDARLTRAVHALFQRTCSLLASEREPPAPQSADAALAWLDQRRA